MVSAEPYLAPVGEVSVTQQQGPGAAGRRPPSDEYAERCVLGGMLLSKDAIPDVLERVRAHDFYTPAHEMTYDVILDLYGRGEPADVVTVVRELDKRGNLDRVGGAAFIHDLTSTVTTAANAGYHAGIVADLAVRRRLVDAGAKISHMGFAGNGDVVDLVNEAQAEVYSVNDGKVTEDYSILGDVIQPTMDAIEEFGLRGDDMVGVATGFNKLDEMTNGLQGGQMIVIAARPAMGKSTLGVDILRSCCFRQKKPGIIFSLEMSKQEITMRLISAEAQIAMHRMRRGEIDEAEWARIAKFSMEMEEAPLFIDDSANMSLMEIRAKCRRLKQKYGLSLIVIDYLQLMSSGKKVESRQQEVAEFSRALKLLAKELDVPLIAISQLNRGPEQRTDKRPAMSDLRESGSIEQDADIVMLLHRDDAYNRDSERAGEADIIIAKHRAGPTGDVVVAFQGHFSRFTDMAHDGF